MTEALRLEYRADSPPHEIEINDFSSRDDDMSYFIKRSRWNIQGIDMYLVVYHNPKKMADNQGSAWWRTVK